MGSYTIPWNKYATFTGRASRGEYWTFALVNIVITFVLYIPALASQKSALFALPSLFGLAIIIPGLAVLFRRLHDSGRSAGWIFIVLLPFIGSVWLLILVLLPGTPGDNKYGPNPRTAITG